MSRLVERVLRERNIVLKEIMELDSLEAIALMVHHGLGASIVPVNDLEIARPIALHRVAFGNPPVYRTIGLAERKNNPKSKMTLALFAELGRIAGGTGSTRAKPAARNKP